MTNKRFFGTDGIRGKVGHYPITPDFMVKMGWAVGTSLAKKTTATVVIGKDTRLSGYMLENALASGLNAAGIEVSYLGPMPTPGIAYITRAFQAELGIVVSASHNTYTDNGIKFFSNDGMKLPDRVELHIEALLEQEIKIVPPEQIGRSHRVKDAQSRYIEFCKSAVPHFLSLERYKIALDCAHGATYKIAPKVFTELGAEVVSMGVEPNGLNINDGVGSTHPEKLQEFVLSEQADIGIAFDGDGDRVIMVDHQGQYVDGDEILYIIAKDACQAGLIKDGAGVVGTQMSNLGLEHALQKANIPFVRTQVGDRYIMAALQEKQWILGGESSGHIIWRDAQTTGDGIVSALQVLTMMQKTKQSLRSLLADMQKYPQVVVNVPIVGHITQQQRDHLADLSISETDKLQGKGRVLLRPSGTEPLIRVMVEGEDQQQVQSLVTQLAKTVQSC